MNKQLYESMKTDLYDSMKTIQENLAKVHAMTPDLMIGDLYAVQKEFGLSNQTNST